MVYLAPADLRTATAKWPGLVLSTTEMGDTRLTTLISEMSALFDRMAGDHYESTASTTYIFDGPPANAFGGGGTFLEFPKRVRVVTSVSIISTDGATSYVMPAANYRVHSSFREPATADAGPYYAGSGYDGLELLGEGDAALTGFAKFQGYILWPSWPRAISVTGDWDWAAVPDLVGQAVAWLCVDSAKATGGSMLRATSYSSGRATFTESKSDEESSTGLPVVDRALAVYGRKASSIEVV